MLIKNKIFYLFLTLALIGIILFMLNLIAFPQFHWIVTALSIITALLGVARRYKNDRGFFKQMAYCVLLPVALIGGIIITDFIAVLINPREGHAEYKSPSGEATVVIEYDLVSRPFLYRKHGVMFMTKIPFSFGPGYNETVRHDVIWLSETKVQLKDDYGGVWVVELEN